MLEWTVYMTFPSFLKLLSIDLSELFEALKYSKNLPSVAQRST